MKKLAMILVVPGIIVFATSGTIQAQEPSPDTPGAWLIYPGGTEHWVGNDRYSAVWGSDLHTSIHGALGYSGRYLCPGPNNWDICYWEFYNPPPPGTIIELRGPGVWTIGGDGAQGGQGREKVKSLVVQQNGITIRGQDYDDGTGNMVRQEILFNNGATTALFYLEVSDLTIENLHISGTWPTNSGGYALAIGRYTMIGPDPHATGLIVRNNTFNNLRGMFDETPTVADLTVENNLTEDIYYNIFKKGVTFTGDNTVTDNTFNRVGQSQNYPALQILNHTGATCIDYNTFNGWKAGQYAIRGVVDLSTAINLGTNNVFVNQVGGSGATYQLYSLSAGGYAAGFASSEDVILGCAPANTAPVADPNGPYAGFEGSPVAFDGTSSSDPDGDPLTYGWDFGDGHTGTGVAPSHTYADNGTYNVCLTVTDPGELSDTQCTTADIANVAPTVEAISAPPDPVQINTEISASADFTDPGQFDTHTAVWDWGDNSTSSGTVNEANGSGSVTGSHTYTTPGVYTIKLTVTDKDGDSGESIFQYVVIYDPYGGFVTGGGWIWSPAGAYAADPALEGKATFGFVSKYQKGADVPTGQTQFQFHVANLNFHSTSYQWLVVAGPKAQFKGAGTINGAGHYGFMLTAIDGQINGGGGVDKFRIKIWDKNNSDIVVYDNQMDAAEGADPTTAIGGGSIVIHKAK